MTKAPTDNSLMHCTDLVKDFGDGKGIFGVNLQLLPGHIVGFVGPNGAGKSTTINILMGLTKPDAGSFMLFGKLHDHTTFYTAAGQIGVMFSEPNLDEALTAQQVFERGQQLLRRDCSEQWHGMSQLLELNVHIPIKKLSLGNKKKVGIIYALMHQPELIVMDEPTSGLDPIIKDRFMQLLIDAAANGAGIFLSSHDLSEVQEVADRIIMIKSGQIILDSPADEIISLAQRVFRLIKPPTDLMKKLAAVADLSNVQHNTANISFHTKDFIAATRLLAAEKFYDYYIEKPTLEQAFKEYYE